ncbi:MAG: NYN domain-containing protein [Gammaproteobacteria bacterium]|nr:NYN domain-containing protein [Gammaproteobacteria bacterium]
MRTHIYVDGFNLYYGALKSTSYKWLDLSSLFREILKPHHDILKIKYFTARVKSHPSDPSKPQRQNIYLRALQHYCPEIEIYFGHFLSHTALAPLAKPGRGPRLVNIIKTEEKGSDVNLAVHLLNDGWTNAYDCAIVVTNDSDIAEAMRLVKEMHKGKQLGLITPSKRHPSLQLVTHADFVRGISENALRGSQLPLQIPGTNLIKPTSW